MATTDITEPMEVEEYVSVNNNVETASNGNNDLSSNTKNGSSSASENNLENNANDAKNGFSLTNDPNKPENSSNLTGDPNNPENSSNLTGDPNNPENGSNLTGDPNPNGPSLASDNANGVTEPPPGTSASPNNTEKMNIDSKDEMKNVQSLENEEVTANQQDLKTSESDNQIENINSKPQIMNLISEQDNEITKLKGKLQENETEITEAYKKIDELQKELDEMKKSNKEFESENLRLHQDNYNKEMNLANLSTDRNNIISRYNSLVGSFQELTKKNEELKIEAAHYQSKLGDAKNFKLGDDDPNNSTALTRDIVSLQDDINLYARVKKGVTLNLEAAKNFLPRYGCSLENTANEDSEEKILIKGLLQRILIENVIEMMDRYLKNSNSQLSPEGNRELDLIDTTGKMIRLLSEFEKHRDGVDEVTQVAPIKLRQQIYAVLGDRGFANIKGEQKEHPFIAELSRYIDYTMSRFRTFKDEEKKQENDKLLPSIIREIIKIFFFRLKVQEPAASFKWFDRGEKVDPMQMVGTWDDNIDQWFVDICYFPLIGIDLDKENRKILFQARVAVYKEKKGIFKTIASNIFNKSSTEDKRQQSLQQGKQSSTSSQSSLPPSRQSSNSSQSSLPPPRQSSTSSQSSLPPPKQNSTSSQSSLPPPRQSSLNTKNADPNIQDDPKNNSVIPQNAPSRNQHPQNPNTSDNNRTA
ncbi:hypothetical protein F8M41_017748 [Gigaspora margarita]|uniref:Uncharacterized protein n=2 Tax=Gigaspora margarita TaxID=4874 RepID=A0A8H4AMU1_GIGMA|nr:hypothetical protein F8M41_017748 [Gigaspora margarita]